MNSNPHTGSTFDSFLEDEGIELDPKVSGFSEDLAKSGKCVRCGKPNMNGTKGGRCKACMNKLTSKRHTVGSKERAWNKADGAARRDRGANGTAHAKSKGRMKDRKSFIKRFQHNEKETGSKLSPDRVKNDTGYTSSNVRNVPEKLNRGRHHVDPKKLKAWKKRLKKCDTNYEEFYTYLLAKATELNDTASLSFLENCHPGDIARFVESENSNLILEKAEFLAKEAAKKLPAASPAMPSIHNEVGKTHTVEIHPHLDQLYRAKGLIKENNRDHLHISDFKKHGFPHKILPRDAHGKVTPEMIDKRIADLPKTKVDLHIEPYTWGSQQHRPGEQYVVTAHLNDKHHDKANSDIKNAFNHAESNQHNFEHAPSKQFGWARIDPKSIKDNHWHIDEIQSDFQNKDKIKSHYNPPSATVDDLRYKDFADWSGTNELGDNEGSDEAKKHPAYNELYNLSKDVTSKYNKIPISGYPGTEEALSAWDEAKKRMYDAAQKHGIVKPSEHYQRHIDANNKELDRLKSKAGELHAHLSHGHDDPQHAIHSAVNALGRKLGVKSMSMDKPEDQARQSGLGNNDAENERRWQLIDDHVNPVKDRLHKERWDGDETKVLMDKNSKNPNFKSGLKKIGGLNVLKDLAGSFRPIFTANHEAYDPHMAATFKKLSVPEKDALSDFLNEYQDSIHDDAYGEVSDELGSGTAPSEDKPFNVGDLPVHQQQTYHQRPKKLGMKEVPKADILGEDPGDPAEKVQYMNLHKRSSGLGSRAWKKRLKKANIDEEMFFTSLLAKANETGDASLLEMLNNMSEAGVSQYIDIFDDEGLQKSVKVLDKDDVVYFDVNETLLDKNNKPIVKNIEKLKEMKAKGYGIVVWSGSKWKKAKDTVEKLGLTKYVDAILSKPEAYVDDKTADKWMGEHKEA